MPTRFKWNLISDERLLDTRICDLPLRIKGSFIEPHIKRLYSELNDRGIRFKPHVWLSAEWFTPDGVPGFAIPFYLAHPRLMKLERNGTRRRIRRRILLRPSRFGCNHAQIGAGDIAAGRHCEN